MRVGDTVIPSFEGVGPGVDMKAKNGAFAAALDTEAKDAGYPAKADPASSTPPLVILLLLLSWSSS